MIARPLVDALISQGQRQRQRGQFAPALVSYRTARALAERLGDRRGQALALSNIGAVHGAQSDYAQALSHYERGLALVPPTDKDLRQAILQGLGVLHRRQGNYELAVSYYQQSLRLAEEIDSKDSLSLTLNNLGMTYRLQVKPDPALAHYQRALALSEELGIKARQGMIINNIGIIHRARSRRPTRANAL